MAARKPLHGPSERRDFLNIDLAVSVRATAPPLPIDGDPHAHCQVTSTAG